MFNRHEILKKHYREDILGWNWEMLSDRLVKNSKDPDCCEPSEDGSGGRIAYCFIGSIFALTPSGKIYTFWTTNQTRADETRDAAWFDALEEVCEEHDCFTTCPDGCAGDDIFIARYFEEEEES